MSYLHARSVVLAAALLAAASSCGSSRIAGPHELRRLSAAEAQWRSRSFTDYQFEIRTSCFCVLQVTRWTRVTVVGGEVVAAEPLAPLPELPDTRLDYWQPIDSLFARLRRTLTDGESGEFYATILAEYHPTLGYPTRIDYRAHPFIADGDVMHELRNVVPH
jgi:hypothetical protein